MQSTEFYSWREWMGWSQAQAAKHLGIGRRSVQLYESGVQRIPKPVELATAALTQGVREYRGPTLDEAGRQRFR